MNWTLASTSLVRPAAATTPLDLLAESVGDGAGLVDGTARLGGSDGVGVMGFGCGCAGWTTVCWPPVTGCAGIRLLMAMTATTHRHTNRPMPSSHLRSFMGVS